MSRVSARRAELTAGGSSVRSVRLRLTALYSGLFLLCGAGLLAITYVLVDRVRRSTLSRRARRVARRLVARPVHTHLVDLHQLLAQSGVALAIMTVVSVVLGWGSPAGVLRPLRAMTAATRRISEQNLDRAARAARPAR